MYPGTASIPSVVETPPTGDGHRDEYILWRERRSGGWYKEAVGSLDHVTDEYNAERVHYAGAEMPTYRLVKVTITEHAEEVALP